MAYPKYIRPYYTYRYYTPRSARMPMVPYARPNPRYRTAPPSYNRGVSTYRRRTSAAKPRGIINRAATINPDYYVTKLRYISGPINVEPDNQNFWTVHTFTINNLYDLDNTGTGYQPDGYDQLATLWNAYCVTGCKYKVVANTTSTTGVSGYTNPRALVVVPRMYNASTPGVAASTLNVVAGQPYSKMAIIGPVYGDGSRVELTGYVSVAKIAGLKDITVQGGYSATVGNAPSNMIALDFYRGRPNDGVPALGVSMNIELTVYCKFYSRKATFDV